jgi:hypothetical protein
VADAVRQALKKGRGDRNGRFWIDLEEREVTMAIGESADNKYKTASF